MMRRSIPSSGVLRRPSPCSGSAAENAAERGKRVVEEALQALGGDAYLHMEDRVETGRAYSFYRQELSGLSMAKIYTRYLTPAEPPVPGKILVREREAFGKDEDSAPCCFTENGAWEITFRGARPLEDQRYDNWKDSTLRNILLYSASSGSANRG